MTEAKEFKLLGNLTEGKGFFERGYEFYEGDNAVFLKEGPVVILYIIRRGTLKGKDRKNGGRSGESLMDEDRVGWARG